MVETCLLFHTLVASQPELRVSSCHQACRTGLTALDVALEFYHRYDWLRHTVKSGYSGSCAPHMQLWYCLRTLPLGHIQMVLSLKMKWSSSQEVKV